MTPRKSPRFPLRARRGFALLITITLLAFLVLLLVSLASLTRVETQVADNSQKSSQARANALLALNLALGQLQRFSGPDQRVTAPATIGDSTNNNLAVPVNGSRQWIGVWGNANAFTNERSNPRFLNWLVSGNEATAVASNPDGSISSTAADPARKPSQAIVNLSSATALSTNVTIGGEPARLLVGPGTVGTTATGGLGEAGYVAAPLRAITVASDLVPGLGAGGTPAIGRYAWWVGDEGIKARADLVEGEESIDATGIAEKRLRYRVPARAGVELMANAPTSLAGADLGAAATSALRGELRKIVETRQLPLTAGGTPFSATFLQQRFHDISTSSQGVLSNALAGGLRKDLTAGFAKGKNKADAPTGPIWQLGTTDELKGADWQLLRSYYQLPYAATATGSGDTLSLSPQPQIDGTTDPSKAAQEGVFPVVAAWQCYAEGRVAPAGPVDFGFELRYYPAIVLWNPYNVTLKSHTYRVTYATNGGDITYLRLSKTTATPTHNGTIPAAISAEAQLGTPWVNGVRVAVESGDMEPGVAYVYTLSANTYFSSDNFTSYTLRRGWRDNRSIIVGGNSFSLPQGTTAADVKVSFWTGTHNSGTNTIPSWTAASSTYATSIPSSGTEPAVRDDSLILATSTGETLQEIRANNNFENAFKLRWVNETFLLQPAAGIRPVIGYFGHRWALKATAPNDAAWKPSSSTAAHQSKNNPVRWLADYNPRAAYSTRSAFEMQGNDVGYGSFQTNPNYNFNLKASAQRGSTALNLVNAEATIPCDPDTGRTYVGLSQTEWDGAGESRVVLFNIPRKENPIVSLGELQHAQPYRVNGNAQIANASPAYPIGNSLADPRGRLDASNNPWSEIAIGSSAYGSLKSTARVFDYSYLLNRALWDGYYFSSVSHESPSAEVTFPLSNPRLVLHERTGASLTDDLRDYDKSAALLVVNGSFNINSTSAQAWRAVLGGLNNVKVNAHQRAKESPYPRSGYPISDTTVLDPATTANAGKRAPAYEGYRFLTATQIETLADQIVLQVRRRGPFVSLADFINRALVSNPLVTTQNAQLKGALAQALEDAGINAAFAPGENADRRVDNGYSNLIETAAAGLTATHVPGWVSQADLLQSLGPILSARSDTFTIRAYGEALNPVLAATDANYIQGRAWCEAVVQRMPEFVSSANDAWTAPASLNQENRNFGRRYRIVSFRWLSSGDI